MSTIRSLSITAVIVMLALGADPAMAGCNSGNVANTSLLSDAACQGNASGADAVAVGLSAAATNGRAVAIGANAEASGLGATAIGGVLNAALRPIASGDESTAIGGDSQASGVRGMAFGAESRASGAESIALRGIASGVRSIAIGDGSQALGATSTAIGDGAIVQAGAANAVALGNGSVATQSNTVSVGSAGAERRVVNVAPGVNGTDAVNVDQLNSVAIGGAAPLVEQLINRMGALESRLDEVTRNSYRGIAGVAAMAVAIPAAPGKTAVNLGVGAYEGYSAVGASIAHLSSSGRYNLNGGLSYSGGKSVARVGVGFSF